MVSVHTSTFDATSDSCFGRATLGDIEYWNKLHEKISADTLYTNQDLAISSCRVEGSDDAMIERGILIFNTDNGDLPKYPAIKDIRLKINTADYLEDAGGLRIMSDQRGGYPHSPPQKDDFSIEHYDEIGKIEEDELVLNTQTVSEMEWIKSFFFHKPPVPVEEDKYTDESIDKDKVVKTEQDTGIALITLPDKEGNKPIAPKNCQRIFLEGPQSSNPPQLEVDWTPARYIEFDDDNPKKVNIGNEITFTGTAYDSDTNDLDGDVVNIIRQGAVPFEQNTYVNEGSWTITTTVNEPGDYWMFAQLPEMDKTEFKDDPVYGDLARLVTWPESRVKPNGSFATMKLTAVEEGILTTSFPTTTTIDTALQVKMTGSANTIDDWEDIHVTIDELNGPGSHERWFDEGGTIDTAIPGYDQKGTRTFVTNLSGDQQWLKHVTNTDVTDVKGITPDLSMESKPTYLPFGTTVTYTGSLTSAPQDIQWTTPGTLKGTIRDREIPLFENWTDENGSVRTREVKRFPIDSDGTFEVEFVNNDWEMEELYTGWPPTEDHPRFEQVFSNTIATNISTPTFLQLDVDERASEYGDPWKFSGSLRDVYHDKGINYQDIKLDIDGNPIRTETTVGDAEFSFSYVVPEGSTKLSIGDHTMNAKFEGGSVGTWQELPPGIPPHIKTKLVNERIIYAPDSTEVTFTLTKKAPNITFNVNDKNPVPSTSSHTVDTIFEGYLEDVKNPNNEEIYLLKDGTKVDTSVTGISGGFTHTVVTPDVTGNYDYKAKWDGNDLWTAATSTSLTLSVSKETARMDLLPATQIPYVNETVSYDGYLLSDHGAKEEGLTIDLLRNGSVVSSDQTNSDGEFNLEDSYSSTGNVTYSTSFGGNDQLTSNASDNEIVTVINEPPKLEPKGQVKHKGTEITFSDIKTDINALAKSDSVDISFSNIGGSKTNKFDHGDSIEVKLGWDDQNFSDLPVLFSGEIVDIENNLETNGEVVGISAEDGTIKYNHKTLDKQFSGTIQEIVNDMFVEGNLDDDFTLDIVAPNSGRYEETLTLRDKKMIDGLEQIRNDAERMTGDPYVFYVDDSTFHFRKEVKNQDSPDVPAVGSNISSLSKSDDTGPVKNRVKVKGGKVYEKFTETWTNTTTIETNWNTDFIVDEGIARPGAGEQNFGKEPVVKVIGSVLTKGEDYEILSYELGKIKIDTAMTYKPKYNEVEIEYWNHRNLYSYNYGAKGQNDGLYEDSLKWFEDEESYNQFGKKENVIEIDFTPTNEIVTRQDLKNAREELNKIASTYLDQMADPFSNISISVPGMLRTRPGQLKTVDYPDLDINNQPYKIKKVSHKLNKGSGLSTDLELKEPVVTIAEMLQDIASMRGGTYG